MTTLILASRLTSGLSKIRNLLNNETKGKILIIPTASTAEGWTPEYEKHYLPFEEMGYTTEEFDLIGKTPEETSEKLNEAVAVYVCGGNSFLLLEHMRKSGFSYLIKKRIEEGLTYIGSSAGSVVATPNIIYAGAVDDPSNSNLGSDYNGLSLIDQAVIPHMDNVDFKDKCEKLYDRMIEKGYKTQPLNDDQIIYVKNDNFAVV